MHFRRPWMQSGSRRVAPTSRSTQQQRKGEKEPRAGQANHHVLLFSLDKEELSRTFSVDRSIVNFFFFFF